VVAEHEALEEGFLDKGQEGLSAFTLLDEASLPLTLSVEDASCPAQRTSEGLPGNWLEQIAAQTKFDSLACDVKALVGGDEDKDCSRAAASQLADGLESRYTRHAHVHEDDVRGKVA
jgi:hypothetical protein